MKNTRNKIGEILRNGLSDGRFEDFELYLFEKSISEEPRVEVSEDEKNKVLSKLEKLRERKIDLKSNLENVKKFNHFGELLKSYIEYNGIEEKYYKAKTGFDKELILSLIKNKINIISVEKSILIKFFKNLKVSLTDAIEIIEKTYKLCGIEPLYSKTMARYKPGENLILKEKSMRSGFNELMLLANNKKEFKSKHSPEQSEDKFKEFLNEFIKEYKNE